MRRVSATEFARHFARIQHEIHREVVEVTSHGRATGYFLSPEDYAEFADLRAKARRIFRVGELPDEMVRALNDARMDPRHAPLDALEQPMPDLGSPLRSPNGSSEAARAAALPPVPSELRPLISRIEVRYRPLRVWLFGSRARGESHRQSDWDLMVIVSDDAPDDLLDPMFGWTVQRDSGVYADIVCARHSEFISDLAVANTAAREVERDGVLLYAA